MSTSRGSGAGSGVGVQPIPAGSRKMVQSLKEMIVNYSETEIYATLKDCNMDPNEAVNRLLSQDPFREVKSKKEKKKEGKDTTEPRSRGANNNSSRGKIGADRYPSRGGSTSYNFSESASLPAKSSYKKENGSTSFSSSLSSVPGISGNNRSRVPAGHSDGASAENKGSSFGAADAVSSSIHLASGYQSTWVGAPGQISMADIVKMGRQHNKTSNSTSASHHNSRFPADYESKNPDSGISSAQQIPIYEEWPSIEKPPASNVISVSGYTVTSEQHVDSSDMPLDGINQQSEAEEEEEEVQEKEDDDIENFIENNVESDSVSSRKIQEDDSGGASLFDNDLYKDMGSYTHQAQDFHEVEEVGVSVSSVTRNLQQLSVEQDDRRLPSEGCTPSVVIPDHLQVQIADCSHLSFGSFGSGMTAAYSSGTVKSVPVETNLEEPHSEANISSVGHLETRPSEYYVEDSLRNASDGGMFHRSSGSAVNYDPSPAPQEVELKAENAENADVAHANQYSFPSANPGYTFDDAQRLNAAFNHTSPQMQNLAPFSDVMQSYTNALPSNLPPANVHPTREADLQYSQFPVTQSLPTKYGNSVSSIGGSAISMSEALKTGGQSAPHTLSGTSVATGPPLPQHLPVHPYSQPTLPLGPYANMIGYPFLPQSFTYLPSAFQQAFAGNSTYHQSLAAVLPQYKNSISASSFPPSAAVASAAGYGAFGNNTSIPANFGMNAPAAPSGTNLNYEDVLSSQYKESLASLQQQNENSAMWLHGANSRTMPAVPASTYYNYQGQNQQQSGGFRQGQQQPSQNYGGYPNFYHSQTGVSHDQQQNPRDGSLGGSQGQQPKQSQIWQNSY